MEKQIIDQKRKAKESGADNKLLSIPGIKQAIKLVRDCAWLCAIDETLDRIENGELGADYRQLLNKTSAEDMDKFFDDEFLDSYLSDTIDEWLEWFAHTAGPKIAELWDLSEGAGDELAWLIYWGKHLYGTRYFLPFVLVTDTKDARAIRAFREKYMDYCQKNAVVVSPKGMQPGHIYLDVTFLPYRSIPEAYGAILLCRRCLGIRNRDLREGAPESVDTERALKCVRMSEMGLPSKEIARKLGFSIYSADNPSGSYPLFGKYIKRGREIQRKLEALSTFLMSLEKP